MTHATWLVVEPFETGDGPDQMGRDDALAERAACDVASVADSAPLRLRFYGWAPPTLSLGYFQRVEDLRADPRWRGKPWVRRPSGGGAIWHHADLTYALAVPPSHPLARQPRRATRLVHEATRDWLNQLGWNARLHEQTVEALRDDPHALAENPEPRKPFLCFLDRDPVDVVVLGPARDQGGVAVDMEMKSESESESKSESGLSRPAKVLGSAQRRRGRALLQHGSLLLTTAAPANELVGLADLPRQSAAVRVADAPAGFAPESWVCPWARRLAEALEARLEWREPEPEERERGRVLSEVYRNPAWLFKR